MTFDCDQQKTVFKTRIAKQPACKHGPMIHKSGNRWMCTKANAEYTARYHANNQDKIAEYNTTKKRRMGRRDYDMRRTCRARETRIATMKQALLAYT